MIFGILGLILLFICSTFLAIIGNRIMKYMGSIVMFLIGLVLLYLAMYSSELGPLLYGVSSGVIFLSIILGAIIEKTELFRSIIRKRQGLN